MKPTKRKKSTSTDQVSRSALEQLTLAMNNISAQVESVTLPDTNAVFADVELQLKRLNDSFTTIGVEVSKSLDRYTMLKIKDALNSVASVSSEASQRVKMLFADFVSPKYAEELKAIGVNYVDTTGNLSLLIPESGVYLDVRRVNENPYREVGRPLKSLSGEPSALVVRGLLDLSTPVKAADLIRETGVSRASAYRTLDYLEGQALITRSAPGVVDGVVIGDLIREVSQWFAFGETGSTYQYIAPRGLEVVIDRLRGAKSKYALTGSAAASKFTSIAPTVFLSIYATDADALAEEAGLQRVPSGGDVFINIPQWDLVFQRTQNLEGLTLTATAQIAIDLVNGPGRDPQLGEAIIEWIEKSRR